MVKNENNSKKICSAMMVMLLMILVTFSCNKDDEPGSGNGGGVDITDPLKPEPAITTTGFIVFITAECYKNHQYHDDH